MIKKEEKMNHEILTYVRMIPLILLAACGVKAILGFHFPWEKCSCCNKRWGDHHCRRKVKSIKY